MSAGPCDTKMTTFGVVILKYQSCSSTYSTQYDIRLRRHFPPQICQTQKSHSSPKSDHSINNNFLTFKFWSPHCWLFAKLDILKNVFQKKINGSKRICDTVTDEDKRQVQKCSFTWLLTFPTSTDYWKVFLTPFFNINISTMRIIMMMNMRMMGRTSEIDLGGSTLIVLVHSLQLRFDTF